MEEKHFVKIEQWFVRLSQEMATKQQLENRFNLLTVSMQNLLDRFQKLAEKFNRLEETTQDQKAEMTIVRLAIKRLEDEIEELRSHY